MPTRLRDGRVSILRCSEATAVWAAACLFPRAAACLMCTIDRVGDDIYNRIPFEARTQRAPLRLNFVLTHIEPTPPAS